MENSKESILPGGWKLIPGLLKRFTKSGSDFYEESCPKSWCTNIKTFLRMSITLAIRLYMYTQSIYKFLFEYFDPYMVTEI